MKKNNKTLYSLILVSIAILFMFCTLQTGFAADVPIDNTTSGGINGAITDASTNHGDTILLNPGNYTGTNNTGITINKNITIKGNGPTDQVIIDAEGQRRIFTIADGTNVTLINITFLNGMTGMGGAAIFNSGTVEVTRCNFINNSATTVTSGGAIWSGGTLYISESNFTNNTAANSAGGAISNSGGTLEVSSSSFVNNSAGTTGGAISNSGAGTVVEVTSSSFVNNTAGTSGGAIFSSGTLEVTSCNFINNTASTTSGGAIWSGGTLYISESNFTNNTAANSAGGAISNSGAGTVVEVTSSSFVNNSAGTTGGAIFNSGAGTVVEVTSSSFVNNSAGTSGGAIFNNGGTFEVSSSNLVNNTAFTSGGAICNGGTLYISESNFTNNTVTNGSGGAILNSGAGAVVEVSSSSFVNNTVINGGGAIFNSGGTFEVSSCNFVNNSATTVTSGGAIFNSGTFYIFESNFVNNTAANSAGGAISNSGAGTMKVSGSSFVNNSAGTSGGAIFNNGGSMLVSSNVMNGNTANRGNAIFNSGAMGILNLTYIGNSTLNVRIGQKITLYATLTDDMGNPITGQNISFYLNGVLYENIMVTEGLAEINFTASPTGLIPVSGEYAGNGNFDILINNGLLIVNKINVSSTIVVPEKVIVGREVNITGVATGEDGNPLANTVLTVTVDGKTYTVKTDSNGRWSLPYIPTHAGNVEASVSWAGNDTHNGFNNSTNFNVVKRNIIVTITATENPDGSVTIVANATYEDDGSPAAGYPVDFFLDGEIIGTGVTDSNGIATLTIPANKISDGPHTISVVVIGGNTANDATTSIEFTKTSKDNPTNKTSDKPTTTTAAMKNTGIPIISIILLLLTSIGLIVLKRKN